MRKVLAITVALMIAAMVSTTALGYTIQSAGNQSYTVTSQKVNYSVGSGTPAHNLTQEMVAAKKAVNAPAVQGTRVPYSFKPGSAMPYSIRLVGVQGVREGFETKKEPAVIGKTAAVEETKPAEVESAPAVEAAEANVTAPEVNVTAPEAIVTAPEANVTAPEANVTAPVEAAPAPVEPKFTIEGMVFNDADGNGVKDINETGLEGWTVNLEQGGNLTNTATTAMDGRFAFLDLVKGDYTVTEVLQMGWKLISPADGKFAVTINDSSVTNLEFANQMLPLAPENATTPAELPAPENTTV